MDELTMSEMERVINLLKGVWEQENGAFVPVDWLLKHYQTFASMAAAVIADRQTPEAMAFDVQHREVER